MMKTSTQATIRRIFSAIVLMVVLSGSALAQKWTIYDGSTHPLENVLPKFTTSNLNNVDADGFSTWNTIIVDPDNQENNLLQFVDSYDGQRGMLRSNLPAGTTKLTFVTRIKAYDIENLDWTIDIDFDFGGFREQFFIMNDSTVRVRRGTDTTYDLPETFDLSAWNTFRFVFDTEADPKTVTVYLNEETTPFITAVPASAGSNNYFRFGNGDSNKNVGFQMDWAIWDVTGAYAPGEGIAIPDPVVTPSWNADLTEIKVNDVAIADFDAATTSYSITLPYGSPVPIVVASAADPNASVAVTPAADVPGEAQILVTAENGETTKTYTVAIEEAPHNWIMYDASTHPLQIVEPKFTTSNLNNVDADGFSTWNTIIVDPDNQENNLLQFVDSYDGQRGMLRSNLPAGTTKLTFVTRIKAYDIENLDWTIDIDFDFGGFREQFFIMNDSTVRVRRGTDTTYDLPETFDLSAWNTFRFVFDTETDPKTVTVYLNEETTPFITAVPASAGSNNYFRFGNGDSNKNVGFLMDWAIWDVTGAYAPGEGDIIPDPVVTPSWDATLTALNIDGNLIEGFDAATTDYEVVFTEEVTTLPVISATANDEKATLEITQIEAIPGTATVAVTAENGITVKTYNVVFRYVSTDATLSEIKVGDTAIENFAPETTEYSVLLPAGTTEVPTITAVATFEGADVVVTPAESLPGNTTIMVTAEDEETTKTYTVSLRAIATDATLATLLVNDAAVEGFDPATTTYNVELPAGTTDIPVVTANATDENAEVTITQATELPGSAVVSVVAEDETTTIEYTINFTVSTSAELISAVGFKLFPNPATSSITVEIDNAAFGAEIKIICISGREVMHTTLYNQSKKIDISELERGMYIMQVMNNGKQTQQLFIKK
ncbi:MAG: T9SS type A sorting domain-containing protein [Tenuifilaceae bacterium]|jgi:hypothetical protein|nr:T9SS type A sorting domain-containing protein [Tenuifilaceae bacterium]